MPMNFNISARIFIKVIREVTKFLRAKGFHINAYLDYWFLENF